MRTIIDATYGEAYLTAVGVRVSGRKAAAANRDTGNPHFRHKIARAFTSLVNTLARAEYRFPPDYYLGP